MKIFNTMTRSLEDLVPLDGTHVRMYTCGPTVYNAAHIGNFRTYVFEDLLRRQIQRSGYGVTQVMNLTDVDDKTIRGAEEAGISLDAYTKPFKEMFFADVDLLGIERAEHYPAATDHIAEVIALISRLFEKGYAYQSEDGSVYFSIAKFSGYGRLGKIDLAGMQAGARVAHDEYEKENVADFALWKAWDANDGAVKWDSPWGPGRPGWHIECSAMSMRYLGDSFDIHTGGVDNIFPHHDDEIAQSEAATGKPFVRYWMHSAHLIVDGKKMSKSAGNFYTLRDIIAKGYSGREIRYVLLSGHYRQQLNFTFDAADAAKVALGRIDDFMERLRLHGGTGDALPSWAVEAKDAFDAAMDHDLNVPEALAAVFALVHAGNKALDRGEKGFGAAVLDMIMDMDRVLGVLVKPEESIPAEVQSLLDERAVARASKDWAASDRLRDELAALGWAVRDTPDGQKVTQR